jgi:hypothetical protein
LQSGKREYNQEHLDEDTLPLPMLAFRKNEETIKSGKEKP